MKRIIIPNKICGLRVSQHCYDRMRWRNIHPSFVEEILTKRSSVKSEPWKKRKLFFGETTRGFITVLTDLNEKTIKTCWVN